MRLKPSGPCVEMAAGNNERANTARKNQPVQVPPKKPPLPSPKKPPLKKKPPPKKPTLKKKPPPTLPDPKWPDDNIVWVKHGDQIKSLAAIPCARKLNELWGYRDTSKYEKLTHEQNYIALQKFTDPLFRILSWICGGDNIGSITDLSTLPCRMHAYLQFTHVPRIQDAFCSDVEFQHNMMGPFRKLHQDNASAIKWVRHLQNILLGSLDAADAIIRPGRPILLCMLFSCVAILRLYTWRNHRMPPGVVLLPSYACVDYLSELYKHALADTDFWKEQYRVIRNRAVQPPVKAPSMSYSKILKLCKK